MSDDEEKPPFEGEVRWRWYEGNTMPPLPPGPGIICTGPGKYIRGPPLSERARGLLPGRNKCRHKKPEL